MSFQNFFLLQENQRDLLQENGAHIIIETIQLGDDGPSGGKSKQVGVSLVKKQLGNKPFEKLTNFARSKLIIPVRGFVTIKTRLRPLITHNRTISKIISNEQCIARGVIVKRATNTTKSKLIRYETNHTINPAPFNTSIELEASTKALTKEKQQRRKLALKIEKIHKTQQLIKATKLFNLIKAIPINEELLNTPIIQVTLASSTIQQGNLLRITADVNKQVPQLWMRILGKNGVIIQKAGLVKVNATGFQILVATQQLDKAIYTVQVSTSPQFTTAGVSQIEIIGKSPINPAIALFPIGLLSPGTQQDITFVKYRTMLDKKVDAQCRPHEGKRFRIDNPNKPVIPQHWGCRCFYEVD